MQIRYQFIRKHISSVCIKAFWKTLYVIGIVSAFIRCTMCVQHKIRRRRTWKICFMQCDFGSFAHLLAAVPWDFLSFSFSIAWNEHWACWFCPYRELILFLFFYFSLFLFRSSYFLCMQSILLFSFRHSSDWWLPSNRTKKNKATIYRLFALLTLQCSSNAHIKLLLDVLQYAACISKSFASIIL